MGPQGGRIKRVLATDPVSRLTREMALEAILLPGGVMPADAAAFELFVSRCPTRA